MSKRMTARLAAATAAMAVGGSVLAIAPPAMAKARDGKCDTNEFCLYFNSGQKGSLSDFTSSVSDYGAKQPSCFDFKSTGAGKGKCVKNATASVWNRSKKTVRVYFNSGYKGKYQDIKASAKANLNSTLKNQNAGHQFLGSGPTGCKTDGTDSKLPSTILVYRVKLGKVERVNFNYYVKNVLPNEWITSWPRESLRAGAVAVKNHGWYWALHSNRKINGVCYDVRDDTGSQVYRPGSALAVTTAAVDATWKTRMTRSGKIFNAQYCSTTTACRDWRTGDWLSQYGSADKARAGQSFRTILKAYYYRIALVG